MAAKTTAETAPANTQEIARIRDIVLGPHIREYDQRFQQTARDLERLRMDIEKLTEQLHEQADAQARSLDQQVQRLQTSLSDQDQRDVARTARGKQPRQWPSGRAGQQAGCTRRQPERPSQTGG